MYERMLHKQVVPTVAEMTEHCAESAELFSAINQWLATTFHTEQKVVFPYGNNYGWGIGHYKKKKLICNIFAEAGAFTVMIRLTNTQLFSMPCFDDFGVDKHNIRSKSYGTFI